MRNLKIISVQESLLPSDLPLTATTWDTNDNSIICAFGPTPVQPVITLKRRGIRSKDSEPTANEYQYELITSWDAPCPLPDLDCDEILLLRYFADTATACLILAGGDLVVVRESPGLGQEKIEIVGSVDAGIVAAAWAPDEELLAIVTRSDTLILMSRDFEPITEATLRPEDLKASKHVSVGWGKKETQFQGKRAKALRDPTLPESVDEGKPSPFENGRTVISWRGDGAFFAINSIVHDTRRAIRVYSREAILDSVSEPVDGLESALSWRPCGNLITAVQRCTEKLNIIFFERNGLRHGEFPLRLSKEDMKTHGSSISLSWNINSTVLAVSLKDRAQFWTMGNYHYYLKQEIQGLAGNLPRRTNSLDWHTEQPFRCSISTSKTFIEVLFDFVTCRGSTVPPHDYGSVAVIDGNFLKLTPLRYANVPPPMSLGEITARENIIDCSMSKKSQYVAILTRSEIEMYKWQDLSSSVVNGVSPDLRLQNVRKLGPDLVLQFRHPLEENRRLGVTYTQIRILGDDEIVILGRTERNSTSKLVVLSWRDKNAPPVVADGFEQRVNLQNITADIGHETLWGHTEDETIAIVGHSVGSRLPSNVPCTEIVRLGSLRSISKISLSSRGELLANTRLLSTGCTSFLVTDQHLIFTTSNHYLKFVHLCEEVEKLEVPPDTPEIDERCRSIERGAILVTAIPSTYAVVLQMPRGNLETIFPRVLVVAGVRRHLLEKDFRKAFVACQSHQVDLNLLHDYRPDIFLDNIELFIDQVRKPSRVDEFLSKLKEEDVSRTMYQDTLMTSDRNEHTTTQIQPRVMSSVAESHLKVNRICTAFISTLQRIGPSRYQNLITAYVSKSPPDFISALTLISEIRKADASAAGNAVSHLVFLSDASRLYNVALSTYDLELTVSIAESAQMDPREYLPFLEQLHGMEPLPRQYEIDNHLGNYSKALEWLYAQNKHDDVEAYTVKHNLYKHAIGLYKYSKNHLNIIVQRYANYLRSQSRYLDAAIAFESLGEYDSAYPSYALAHRWREALACACLVPLAGEELRTLARSLATTLAEETRDYRSAASVHIDYLQDVTSGVRLLCRGSYFAEAIRLLALHQLTHTIPQTVDISLTEKLAEIIELLADCKSQLSVQVPRIKDLRVKKIEDPLAFFGGDPTLTQVDGDIPDNISLAPTDASTAGGQSLFTRYGSNNSKFGGTMTSNVSHKTSKTKRREERKRARGKKGSVYEEEYLVASVARLIERLNGVQDEVRRLIEGLMRRNMREQATAVEENIVEVIKLCSAAKEEVWSVEIKESVDLRGDPTHDNSEIRPRGGEGVLWDSQLEGQETKTAPNVNQWKISSLLEAL